jgi:hypothetical protein
MGIIQDLLQDIPLPRMVKVHQKFSALEVADLDNVLRQELAKPGTGDRVKPGMRIAIAVGSRGVAEIQTITRITVEEIKKRGGVPFVVPAMGSHGGAMAHGQQQVLAELGVTEAAVGCPIVSSMEVVEVGRLPSGLAVLIDKTAFEADGIVVINRVKPHTAFQGPSESGLVKMLSIGLGKQKGADSCHAYSFKHMAEHIVEMAKIKLEQCRFLFGIATVENAYDHIAEIVAVPAENMIQVDQKLLLEAKANMPRIMFDPMEVLIVDRIGKEISGDGMDPNITGRYPTPYASGGPAVNKLVVLDLTEKTHGNANGMGAADFITRELVDKADWDSTYANALTSTVCGPIRIPMVLASDREAICAAVKTSFARDLTKVRLVRVKDTLSLEEIYISEALLDEAKANPDIEICGSPEEMKFDAAGNLLD